MMRGMFITAIAVASLACSATWSAAGAASSDGNSVRAGTQQIAPTHTKTTSKTKKSKVERPQTNWLNPQPEPPSPAGNKPVQGGNWLNPQPEPPRPDTAKKPH